jgi:hypothetical protein
MKWMLLAAVWVLAAGVALGAAPPEENLEPEVMLEKNLAQAAKEKKYVLAYFGRAATPTLKAFREAAGKWLGRAGRGAKFIVCYATVSETPTPDSDTCFQGLMDKLDPVPKAWATNREVATPCIFLFDPDGKIVGYGTGADWGDDTDANIAQFLTKLGITGGAIPLPRESDVTPVAAPAPEKSGKPDLGIVVGAVDEATAKQLKLEVDEGVTVLGISQDSLEVGDIIIKINGVRVFNVSGFQKELEACKVGTAATIEVLRDEKPVSVKVVVGSKR